MQLVMKPGEMFGRKLGHAIYVARHGAEFLGDPFGAGGAAGHTSANRVRDHQGGGGRHDEAADAVDNRLLQQIAGADDVHVDKRHPVVPVDIGLMQRAAVDDRLDAIFDQHAADEIAVGNRPDHGRRWRGNGVEADHLMAESGELRGEGPAKPAGRSSKQYAHSLSSVPKLFESDPMLSTTVG